MKNKLHNQTNREPEPPCFKQHSCPILFDDGQSPALTPVIFCRLVLFYALMFDLYQSIGAAYVIQHYPILCETKIEKVMHICGIFGL